MVNEACSALGGVGDYDLEDTREVWEWVVPNVSAKLERKEGKEVEVCCHGSVLWWLGRGDSFGVLYGWLGEVEIVCKEEIFINTCD